MTATGDLRNQIAAARRLIDQANDALDEAVRMADQLDDEAIDAADRFLGGAA